MSLLSRPIESQEEDCFSIDAGTVFFLTLRTCWKHVSRSSSSAQGGTAVHRRLHKLLLKTTQVTNYDL